MAKLSIILSLLATSFFSTEAIRTANITQKYEFDSNQATTVAVISDLFTVSYYNVKVIVNSTEQRQVYLNLTSSNEHQEPCQISLDQRTETIRNRMKAASIGKKILVWGERSTESTERGTIIFYTFLLVDTMKCTYRALSNLNDTVRLFGEPEVVVHLDGMDIFYASQTVCSPCSYDFNGDKVYGKAQMAPSEAGKFYIRTIGREDYAVVYDNPSKQLEVALLNRYLGVEKSSWIGFYQAIRAVAVNSVENHRYLGIVLLQRSAKQLIYILIDENLQVVARTPLPLLDGYDHDDAFANIDSLGNSFVTLMQRGVEPSLHWKRMMVRLDVRGNIVDQVILGTKNHMGVAVDYTEQVVLTNKKEYCLVVHTRRGFKPATESTKIECIDVSKTV